MVTTASSTFCPSSHLFLLELCGRDAVLIVDKQTLEYTERIAAWDTRQKKNLKEARRRVKKKKKMEKETL